MTEKAQAPAVVMGLSPTGLYVIHELGRAWVPVIGVAKNPFRKIHLGARQRARRLDHLWTTATTLRCD